MNTNSSALISQTLQTCAFLKNSVNKRLYDNRGDEKQAGEATKGNKRKTQNIVSSSLIRGSKKLNN